MNSKYVWVAAVAVILVLSFSYSLPAVAFPVSSSQIKHVIVIMEENEPSSYILNNAAAAPYQDQLAKKYASAANYHGISYSLANYLQITGGDYFGCGYSKDCHIGGITGKHIGDLLISKGYTWKQYAESMPSACYMIDTTHLTHYVLFDTGHVPFLFYNDVTSRPSYCASRVVPFEDSNKGFLADLNGGRLPTYSFITPNNCDNGHNPISFCGGTSQINNIDKWLSWLVPKIVSSPEFSSTLLLITYDEPYTYPVQTVTTNKPVYTVMVSPFVKAGFTSTVAYNHYSSLATVERIFNLGNLGRNDATGTPMTDMFKSSTSSSTSSTSTTTKTTTTTTAGAVPGSFSQITVSPSTSVKVNTVVTFIGTLLRTDGTPLSGWTVQLWRAESLQSTTTSATGTFSLSRMMTAAGTVTFTIRAVNSNVQTTVTVTVS